MSPIVEGTPRIEVDGQSASADQLRAAALASYGHFTAMQVRNRSVRGLDRHLARLDAANREIFGSSLHSDMVVARIRHALGDDVKDATVRVYVNDTRDSGSMMVTVRPPGTMTEGPWSLMSAAYQRPLAHLKHIADFGQSYYHRLAHARGYTEALLTAPDGIICEGTTTNIGFLDATGDRTRVVWPAAPALAGITMQVVERELAALGVEHSRAHVRLSDLGSYSGAFVTNSRGIAPLRRVDDLTLPADDELMKTVAGAYESARWDAI